VTAEPGDLDAAVLVGHATRLPGKFDRLLNGRSVLDRVVAAVRDAGFRPTIVAVPGARPESTSVLVDRYDRGPLGAVRTILERHAGPFLLVGGDMPFVRPADLRRLRERYRRGTSVVPRRTDGTFEVLMAIYDLSLEQVVRYWTGGRSLQTLVSEAADAGAVDPVPVEGFDPASFVDLDTPEDFARWSREAPRESAQKPSD
jgi:molybdopterin-guanine dinucleotide biosynthesis protein A